MSNPEITVDQLFEMMPAHLDTGKAGNINVTYQFDLTGPQGGAWWVTVADGVATSGKGQAENPTTTIIADAQDYLGIATGTINATTAFMSGKLKIKGDMGKAMQLQSIFQRP